MLPSNNLQKFGHHLILGVSGTKLSDDDKKILRDLRPVGVIFFAPNFRQDVPYSVWLESLGDLTKQVREYAERDTYGGKPRMFVTIDHEGGRVMRPPLPITRFPYAAFYGEKAFLVGKAMGKELRSLGINISWSPVADIFSNPGNPVIPGLLVSRKILLLSVRLSICGDWEKLESLVVPSISLDMGIQLQIPIWSYQY
jgi:beta-N-acetylhexosaminidase